jgi:pilus assembly protein CpaE
MYPLTAVLIACDDAQHPELRRELAEQGIKIENEFPTVARAVAELAGTTRDPRLFLYPIAGPADCRLLERLNDAFLGRPIVALLAAGADPAFVVEAMRAGAAQVVALPLQPDDLHRALERVVRQFGYPANVSRLIAVSGVSEGSGATTLAINVAAEIASQHHLPTLLVEMSLRMGRLASYLDLDPRFTTHDLLGDMERIDLEGVRQAQIKVADNFHVLAGPYKGVPSLRPASEHVARLVDYARRLAQVVVLDMPYTYDDTYFQTLAAADQVVLVAEPTVPSVQALKTLRETLQQSENAGGLYVVLNRYDARLKDFTVERLQQLLRLPHIYPVANDWVHCADALNSGHVLRQTGKRCRVLDDIDAFVGSLLGHERPAPAAWHLPRFLRRLVSTDK